MENRTYPTLPTHWYFDADHHQRELAQIWGQEWLCVAHQSELASPGQFKVITIGDQQVVLTRTGAGELNAFYNTCRHRGSILCTEAAGQFKEGRVVCPYHGWTYNLEGELTHTPRRIETPDFNPDDFPLYKVALDTWGGFVFINLQAEPAQTLSAAHGEQAQLLDNWPLDDMVVAAQEVFTQNCNWKVFWENFGECLHCPIVHRNLSTLVPLYKEGLTAKKDLPDDHPLKPGPGYLAEGSETWSDDGQTDLPRLPGLSDEERAAGMTFAEFIPAAFVIGHVDYVRSVQLLPRGPEQIEITVNWLLPPEVLASGKVDIPRLTHFASNLSAEDKLVCELNQRGLHNRPHQQGVLLPQEYDVLHFDNWLRRRLGEPEIK